uniref:Uncharacterized protein n=1 Tax=Anguilla anguilla TaxID=7936 RepID=A0A0E9R5T6_ANGAN
MLKLRHTAQWLVSGRPAVSDSCPYCRKQCAVPRSGQ